jgi:hypothetical protein
MSEGFDFLGFRLQWKRKRGTNKWHVYTGLPRVFRTADCVLCYAANLPFRYSVRTSWGVR